MDQHDDRADRRAGLIAAAVARPSTGGSTLVDRARGDRLKLTGEGSTLTSMATAAAPWVDSLGRLIAERPTGTAEPVEYWLSNLPVTTAPPEGRSPPWSLPGSPSFWC